MRRPGWLAFLILVGCGGEPVLEPEDVAAGGKADSVTGAATLVFDKAWNEYASGAVVAGGKVAIQYDEARLPRCRATHNGNPGWQITAYLRAMPSGTIQEAELFAHAAGPSGAPDYYSWVKQVPVLSVPASSTGLQLWFKNVSGFDHPCQDWDSNFGKNYFFAVQAAPAASLAFNKDWSITRKGSLEPGGTLTVSYAPERMKAIAWGPNPYYSFFASKYHCYGYGCCEHEYQNRLQVRFSGGAFTSHDLAAGPVELAIPSAATRVEIYFDADVITTTWYCGGTAGPKSTQGPDRFYDSNFGKNFSFTLD